MSADTDFMDEIAAADRKHAATCKCRTTARMTGPDGPNFATLTAGWQVANALADEFDATPDQFQAKADVTLSALDRFRRVRRGEA